MEDLLNSVANVGFPIVISIYLLIRFEKKLEQLRLAIEKVSDNVMNITHIRGY